MSQLKEYTLNIKRPNYFGDGKTLFDKGWGGWRESIEDVIAHYTIVTGNVMEFERKQGVKFFVTERTVTVEETEIELL